MDLVMSVAAIMPISDTRLHPGTPEEIQMVRGSDNGLSISGTVGSALYLKI